MRQLAVKVPLLPYDLVVWLNPLPPGGSAGQHRAWLRTTLAKTVATHLHRVRQKLIRQLGPGYPFTAEPEGAPS